MLGAWRSRCVHDEVHEVVTVVGLPGGGVATEVRHEAADDHCVDLVLAENLVKVRPRKSRVAVLYNLWRPWHADEAGVILDLGRVALEIEVWLWLSRKVEHPSKVGAVSLVHVPYVHDGVSGSLGRLD